MRGKINHILIILAVCLLSAPGCDKDNNRYIPYVPVDIYINVTLPAYTDLNPVGGWMYINGGSRGIIVYNGLDGYHAYERHSPYQPDNNCTVEVPVGTQYAEDPCSGSQFTLTDGSVIMGPANLPLLEYTTTFDGTTLHIMN